MVSVPASPNHRRTPSRVVENKNVEWVGAPGAWTVYLGFIFIAWLLVLNFVPPGLAWTVVHVIHTCLTFYGFHWIKGTPGLDEAGQHYKETFWEQLDEGVQGTWNRKFLTIVPALLCGIAVHTADYEHKMLGVNIAAVLLSIVPKLPAMSGVRLFGINKY